jgi:[protein-PII] uridylyltransferase
MYHVYTVDEHTVRAVGILTGIESGRHAEELPLASEIVHEVLSREVLYVATFLHDIAKGRGGDHSVLGAEIAETLCPRLGMSDEQTETVAWLVREHLLFSHTAFKRDINDPKTVSDFVGRVQSIERLRLLLVLTAADIRAVGPGRWNGWKGSLLRELYRQAEDVLTGGHAAVGREARMAGARASLRAHLEGWSDEHFAAYAERFAPAYWLTADAETHARHAALVEKAEADPSSIMVETRVDQFRAVTEVTLYAPDRPGLFASLAGAAALAGASIVDAKAFTTADGMALDSLWLQDREVGAFDEGEKLARLKTLMVQAAKGEIDFDGPVAGGPHYPSRTDVFQTKPRVLIDNKASNSHTVIEINGRDRPGLLHDVAMALTALNLSISSAHISTFGTRAVDVFYVKDRYGLKVTKSRPIELLTTRLITTLSSDEVGALAAE